MYMICFFKQPCLFVYSQKTMNKKLPVILPEIAFIGRSNAGKSSLINALLFQKNLVRIGKTPGSTMSVNYFNLGNKVILVDLPGFGYARRAKNKVLQISGLMKHYLCCNKHLSLLVVLIDVRRGLNYFLYIFIRSLVNKGTNIVVVFNKIDVVTEATLLCTKHQTYIYSQEIYNNICYISCKYNIGLDKLRQLILNFIHLDKHNLYK